MKNSLHRWISCLRFWIVDKVSKFNTKNTYIHAYKYKVWEVCWCWYEHLWYLLFFIALAFAYSNVQRSVAIFEFSTCKYQTHTHTWNNWTCKSYLRAHVRLNYVDYEMNYGTSALWVHLCSRAHYRVSFHFISFSFFNFQLWILKSLSINLQCIK